MQVTQGSKLSADLSNWDPEHEETWDKRLAWSTLWITTYSLTLGFATWYLVSAIAPRLTSIGFELTTAQLYWLVALPGLAGGLLRFVWMFLPPVTGTRQLVAWSSLLLALPMLGWTLAVRDAETPYWVLLALSFSAGTLWPFTRLVHVFSAPVGYLFRPHVVYRSRDDVQGSRAPKRGWDPISTPDPQRLRRP